MSLDRSNVIKEFRPFERGPGLVRVNPENLDDVLLLYKLLEERTSEQSISPKKMPTFSQHAEFVQNRPYVAWYFILAAGGVPCGSIYISRQREIGISIFQAYQRQGYGGAAVRELMRKHEDADRPFLANVNPENTASIKFWESLGFKLLQFTYAKSAD